MEIPDPSIALFESIEPQPEILEQQPPQEDPFAGAFDTDVQAVAVGEDNNGFNQQVLAEESQPSVTAYGRISRDYIACGGRQGSQARGGGIIIRTNRGGRSY